MGKTMNELQRQLKNPDTKKDAEACIKIYKWLKETDPDGRVWSSRWNPMVKVRWEGTYPNSKAIYKPSITGNTLLKGIECSNEIQIS